MTHVGSRLSGAWGVQCAVWESSQHLSGVRALWCGQFATFATFLIARSGNGCPNFPVKARASVSCSNYARCYMHGMCPPPSKQQEKQAFLRNTPSQHHTPWLDYTHQTKKSTPEPELQYHHKSGSDLWFYKRCKHAWVDAQLATLESRMDHRASASCS